MKKNPLVKIAPGLVVLLTALAATAQPAYFAAVTNLNPVGYWPMHEVAAAAHGDIETNYGSAGTQANGFYGDWVAPAPASPLTHNWPGAIVADSDTAVFFNYFYNASSGNGGSTTNCLIIPHTSPAAALVPPFTIECWFFRTNALDQGHQADIWSSVNANSPQGLNGITTFAGIRLFLNNTVQIFTYSNLVSNVSAVSTNKLVVDDQWRHLVVTDDGTNITLYVNGVADITNVPNSTYAPNYWDPFEIDTGKGFTRDASGIVDEFAIYTNALSQDAITNHYLTGINPSPTVPYKTVVLNDNPSIYYRMDSSPYTVPSSATLPALTNYGSVAANGFYEPGVAPGGVAGPNNGLKFAAGFGATNAMPGNGMSSYADAGYNTAYNPVGATPYTISAWFKGNYCDSRTQTIVGHGANSWSIVMNTTGHLQCQLGTNTSSALTSAALCNDSNWHQAVDVYTPNSNPSLAGTNALYVDGVLDSMTNGVSVNGILPGTSLDVLIASDPQFTNTSGTLLALGRQFAGNVCEVALFTNALTSGQVQSLYNAGEMPPTIITQPVSATVNQGSAFTNTVAAGGAPSLSYQWYTNGVALAAQTNASLILNPVLASYANTNYYVIVTNNYGSATSAVVSLTVNASAAIIGQFPVTYTNLFTLYAGASPTFSISASGAVPIFYHWFTNGVSDDAATNSSLMLTNVQVGAAITNYCIVSNFVGSTTSTVWAATVIAVPSAPYPPAVLALNPIGYWRLNEADDGLSDGNSNAIAHDYAGGNDGLYTNVVLGQNGYDPLVDPTDKSVEVGTFATVTYTSPNSYASQIGQNVDFATSAGNNAEFSVEAWVSANSDAGPQGSGLVCKGTPNGGEEFALDTTGGSLFRFFVRRASGTQVSATASTTLTTHRFYHLVGVCDESNGLVSLYINGALAGQTSIPSLSGINNNTAVPMTIGARSPGGGALTSQFIGFINDVAVFNYALSSNQVANQYNQTGFAPSIIQQPTGTNVSLGSNAVLTVVAAGTPVLTYQWFDVNSNMYIPGQTNATLQLTNLIFGDSYYVTVTNLFGTINSDTVNVGVYSYPLIINQYPVTYTNLFTLYAGASPTFRISDLAFQPEHYQWFTNGVPVAGANGTNFGLSNVKTNGAINVYCILTNSVGSVTSFVWNATVIANPPSNGPSLAPYPQTVLALKPIGYWRLNEPDDGDGVDNGNDGAICHDYVGGNDGIYTNTVLGNTGYNPLADPTDSSGYFGENNISFVDSYAGQIAGIDFSSPTNTAQAFTVEAWINCIATNGANGIASKGFGGGFVQFDLDFNGPAVRFFVLDAGGTSHSVQAPSLPTLGQWHHLVGVCDEPNGKLSLYIDGALTNSTTILSSAGIFNSSALMSIGARRSSISATHYDNQFLGYINDVAVFNYALSALQITNQYIGVITPSVNQNRTNIVYSLSGNQLTLTWPADHTGWRLQSQTNSVAVGLTTNWFNVANSTGTNQMIMPITLTNGSVFYRLVYP